jgi:hypothetical protein
MGLFFLWRKRTRLFLGRWFWILSILLGVLVLRSAVVSFGFHEQNLMDRLLAVRYDFSPLLLLLVVRVIAQFVDKESLMRWFERVVGVLLLVGIVWYVVVNLVPELLTTLGYGIDAWQWVFGEAPPVRYLTNVRR